MIEEDETGYDETRIPGKSACTEPARQSFWDIPAKAFYVAAVHAWKETCARQGNVTLVYEPGSMPDYKFIPSRKLFRARFNKVSI